MTPCMSLAKNLQTELRAHSLLGQMRVDLVEALVAATRRSWFAPGQTVPDPGSGVVQRLL
jgi:hypothetical protein